jgi:hypothetical protein
MKVHRKKHLNGEWRVDGAHIVVNFPMSNTFRGDKIVHPMALFRYLSSPTNGNQEAIQDLMDLVAKEGQCSLDSLTNAGKVRAGLEDMLGRQKELTTTTASSFGTNCLKAVKVLSNERAVGYTKCIDAWKLKPSILKKGSGAVELITTTKFAPWETVLKDQVKSVTLEQHKDYCRESKLLNNQVRQQVKDLAKFSDLLSGLSLRSQLHANQNHPRA